MPEVPLQSNTPQVFTKKAGFNWKSVLIAALIGAVVIGVAAVGLNYYLGQNESSLETGSVTIKKATPSAETATPSAQKGGTANWKVYEGKFIKVRFKVPLDWNIVEEDGIIHEGKKINTCITAKDPTKNTSLSITEHFFGGFSGIVEITALEKEVIIDGEVAKEVFFKEVPVGENPANYSKYPDNPTQMQIWLAKTGDNYYRYLILASWQAKDFQETKKVIDKVLETVDFL